MSTLVVVSFRLGMADGVSIEAAKWSWAMRELGHEVRTVAGEGICDVTVRGLELAAPEPPDPDELARALEGAECVIVENVCSLPLNEPAGDALARLLAGRP